MATAHHDILEEREPLGGPLAGSLGLHLLVAGLIVVYSWTGARARELWGDPNSLGGGAVAISPVSQIPLPARGGMINPVANDTESQVPRPPSPQTRKSERPDEPDAIAIRGREAKAKQQRKAAVAQRYRPPGSDRPHQLHSSAGAAAATPMFGATTGGGGVGVGSGSPFGTRFGYYEQLLRERVARNWRTQDVDPQLQTAPPVIITFEIFRDGSIRNLTILQRSGNLALDYSCQRAIVESSPFPALPSAFDRNSAKIEFWFQLKR